MLSFAIATFARLCLGRTCPKISSSACLPFTRRTSASRSSTRPLKRSLSKQRRYVPFRYRLVSHAHVHAPVVHQAAGQAVQGGACEERRRHPFGKRDCWRLLRRLSEPVTGGFRRSRKQLPFANQDPGRRHCSPEGWWNCTHPTRVTHAHASFRRGSTRRPSTDTAEKPRLCSALFTAKACVQHEISLDTPNSRVGQNPQAGSSNNGRM